MEFVAEISHPRRPTVGLTPLIDVVFILLIFFMLVVNFSSLQQTPLSNVMASEAPVSMDTNETLLIVLGGSQCELGGEARPCEGVSDALSSSDLVYLGYAPDATLSAIVRVQERLLSGGFKVSLAVPETEGAQ